jgi:hypothetical protein
LIGLTGRRHDIQHNNIQHNDTQPNDTHQKGLICDITTLSISTLGHYAECRVLSIVMLKVMLSVYAEFRCAECQYAECRSANRPA